MVVENKIGSGAVRKDPAYQITRDGFVFLCMGFTGAEAAKWKEAYIAAFNEMEKALLTHPDYRPEATREVHTGGLTLEQQEAVKALHKTLVESVAQDRRGPLAVKLWSSVKKKFGVSYKDVPPANFTAILSLMSRVAVEGEYLPQPESVTQSASAPKHTTAQHQFFLCNPLGDNLFAVRAGVPVSTALEHASCFLDAARSVVYEGAEDAQSPSTYGATYLVEMAKAIVDAAILAVEAASQ